MSWRRWSRRSAPTSSATWPSQRAWACTPSTATSSARISSRSSSRCASISSRSSGGRWCSPASWCFSVRTSSPARSTTRRRLRSSAASSSQASRSSCSRSASGRFRGAPRRFPTTGRRRSAANRCRGMLEVCHPTVDVHIGGVSVSQRGVGDRRPPAGPDVETGPRLAGYVKSVLVVALSTGVAALLHNRFEGANLIMVYLLGVLGAAVSLGRGPAVLASLLSVASFDFFFVPPGGTLAVSDPQYLVTFAVMLLTAIVIATLAARLRTQARVARIDGRRAEALARLSGELVALRDRDRIATSAVRHLEEVFESRAALLLPDAHGRLSVAAGDAALLEDGDRERGVAQWAFDSGHAAGRGTDTLQQHRCLHLPLRSSSRELGVITIAPADPRRRTAPDAIRLLEAFANQVALALERAALADQAERARVQGEAERMRSGLLSSVSHDLRTPLAVITGAATTLLEAGDSLPEIERREMLKSLAEEATRLNQLVGNLLAMTRLEGGALEVRRSWHSLEEIIGAALHRSGPLAGDRPVRIDLPPHLPLVAVDDVLLEQVVFNLVENAIHHAPSSQPIEIRVRPTANEIEVSVADRGPGLPPGAEEQVFEKFYRGRSADRRGGAGLGLAICRGIVAAHGGRLWASDRVGGGAEFVFALPRDPDPPRVEQEAPAGEEERGERALP